MAITFKDETEPKIDLPKQGPAIDETALQRMIEDYAMRILEKKVEEKTNFMELVRDNCIDQVRKIADSVKQTTARVMVVEIEQVKNKLSKPATEYLPRLITNAKLGLNTLLVGPAGCGKTMAASQVSEALGLEFGHVCLTAGASETWLFGRQTPNGFVEGTFSKLYRNGGVFLADEIDAADPNLLLAINTALANGSMYNPICGETIPRHEKFVFIGAANTVGRGADSVYTGRARLDGATLTRFVKIQVGYNQDIEKQVCPDNDLRDLLQDARKILTEKRSPEIISTRCLEQAYLQKQAGVPLKEVLDSLTLGWPIELVEQCGLSVKNDGKKKGKKNENSEEIPF